MTLRLAARPGLVLPQCGVETGLYIGTRWTPGVGAALAVPADGLLVSFTEFTATNSGDLPGIMRAGLRLRSQLLQLPGSFGMLLHSHPVSRRTGSLTAWRDEEGLEQFIMLPDHLPVMAHYRNRGTLQSVKFRMSDFDPGRAMAQARHRLRRAGDGVG